MSFRQVLYCDTCDKRIENEASAWTRIHIVDLVGVEIQYAQKTEDTPQPGHVCDKCRIAIQNTLRKTMIEQRRES
jgi:hypothetical protein